MSFNGIYNITLNSGSPSANSAVVSTDGVKLVAIDKNDPKQKWSIRPVGGGPANAYVIQSAFTGGYVVPNGSSLSYSIDPFIWIIPNTSGFVSTGSLNWLPRDDGLAVIITENRQWTWTIS